jgi:hypothetical protein
MQLRITFATNQINAHERVCCNPGQDYQNKDYGKPREYVGKHTVQISGVLVVNVKII